MHRTTCRIAQCCVTRTAPSGRFDSIDPIVRMKGMSNTATLQADPVTDCRYRFDHRLPHVIEWRGERFANTRDNVHFIRLWQKFFTRHNPIAVKNIWGEIYAHRPVDKRERDDVRTALRMLRSLWYVR